MSVELLDTRHVLYRHDREAEGPLEILFEVLPDGTLELLGYLNGSGAVCPFPTCFRLADDIEAEVREHVALSLAQRAECVARGHERLSRLADDIQLAREEFAASA